MGASVRIEDEAFSDERYEDLAAAAGLADADHARGKMAKLWRQCTLETRHVLPRATVTRILGERGVDALIEARLGEETADGVRIRGTRGRIEWLNKLRKNKKFGKLGGRPKKNPQGFPEKPTRVSESAEKLTPLTLAPAPALTPTISEDQSVSPGGDAFSQFEGAIQRNLGDVGLARSQAGSRRKPRASRCTDAERASALRVLGKLSEQNGVAYRGSDKHIELIVRHLRHGVDEMDLRAVVGYCALEEGWKGDSKMHKFLRPETLFGPDSIEKYLDPARTWFSKLPEDKPSAPPSADPYDEPDWMQGGAA